MLLGVAAKPLCGLPPEKLAQAVALEHWRTALYFGGTAWLSIVLWVLVRLRTGAAIERAAVRVSSRAWVQGLIVAPVWVLIVCGLEIPAALVGHHVGLSAGGYGGWTGSNLLG